MKAVGQCALLSNSQSNIDHTAILKTCDMGLLMGAPIMDNILDRMSRKCQEAFGHRRLDSEDSDTEEVPAKKKREDGTNELVAGTEVGEAEKSVSAVSMTKEREVARCNCPSVEMFNAMFFDLQHPVVISGAIGYWPALTSRCWTLEYLQKVAGARTVPVEIGSRYTEEDWTQKLMTIQEFIDQYITNPTPETKGYLAQHNLFDQVSAATQHTYMFDVHLPAWPYYRS